MKIAILGAGAMGSMVGAFLKKGGGEVYFVDPYEAHMKAVNEDGLTMDIEGHARETVRVNGATVRAADVASATWSSCLSRDKYHVGGTKQQRAFRRRNGNPHTPERHRECGPLKELLPDENIGYGILKSSATLYAPGRIFGRDRFPGSPAGAFFTR